jgi:hypothetical protein
MTVTCSAFIPKEKFTQFHEVLCVTGGRYLANPLDCGEKIHVRYEHGIDHEKLWNLYTCDITEIRRDQWWRVLLRKFGLIKSAIPIRNTNVSRLDRSSRSLYYSIVQLNHYQNR